MVIWSQIDPCAAMFNYFSMHLKLIIRVSELEIRFVCYQQVQVNVGVGACLLPAARLFSTQWDDELVCPRPPGGEGWPRWMVKIVGDSPAMQPHLCHPDHAVELALLAGLSNSSHHRLGQGLP